jgi:hypothetical protein
MSTESKSYWLYGDAIFSEGWRNEVECATYDQARETAANWIKKGVVLVHIRKEEINPYTKDIEQRLVWAAASPQIDWGDENDVRLD